MDDDRMTVAEYRRIVNSIANCVSSIDPSKLSNVRIVSLLHTMDEFVIPMRPLASDLETLEDFRETLLLARSALFQDALAETVKEV